MRQMPQMCANDTTNVMNLLHICNNHRIFKKNFSPERFVLTDESANFLKWYIFSKELKPFKTKNESSCYFLPFPN